MTRHESPLEKRLTAMIRCYSFSATPYTKLNKKYISFIISYFLHIRDDIQQIVEQSNLTWKTLLNGEMKFMVAKYTHTSHSHSHILPHFTVLINFHLHSINWHFSTIYNFNLSIMYENIRNVDILSTFQYQQRHTLQKGKDKQPCHASKK